MHMLCVALLVLVSYAGRTSASPEPQLGGLAAVTPVPILLDERIAVDTLGGFGFRIQTGNGINWNEVAAAPGPLAPATRSGEYSFTHPDGTVHHMRYVADALGFRPESSMIPTPFPLEPWQLEQVRFAEEQRRLQAASGQAPL